MQVEGSYTFNAPRDRVWQLLQDPQTLSHCLPGCQNFTEVGEGQYTATLRIGVAAIKGEYSAKVSLKDQRAPEHYVLAVEGGGRQGQIKGEGALDLTEQGEQTVVAYKGDVQVMGLIASVGQRMLSGAAKMMAGQFFRCMEGQLKELA